jgi:hypothetical protein
VLRQAGTRIEVAARMLEWDFEHHVAALEELRAELAEMKAEMARLVALVGKGGNGGTAQPSSASNAGSS